MSYEKIPQLKLAESVKTLQSKKVQKEIQDLYKGLAQDIRVESGKLPRVGISSDLVRKQYLDDLVRSLESEIDRMNTDIHRTVLTRMTTTAESVVKGNNEWFESFNIDGLKIKGAFNYIPSEVVYNLVNGKVYSGDWSFSQALWKSGLKTKSDMYSVVAKGVAAQKPTFDIAKDLEKYVNPTARKPWDWSKVYPGTNKKVDYSAQRLARTLIQHSYQLSFRNVIKNNPFVTGVIWHSVFEIGRTCLLCMDRDGTVYRKGMEPLDHPSGLCYLEPEIPKDMNDIANELNSWIRGEPNKALDKWYTAAMRTRTKIPAKVTKPAKTAAQSVVKSKLKKPAYFKNINTKPRDNRLAYFFRDSSGVYDKDVEEFYKATEKKVKDFINNGFVGVRVDTDLIETILNDGRLKNQFETGTSRGVLLGGFRKNVEKTLMEVPKDLADAERPIYGMIYPKSEGALKKYAHGDTGDWYGDAIIKMKDEVKDVTSFTVGDSLDFSDELVSAITKDDTNIKGIPYGMSRYWNDMTKKEFEKAKLKKIFGEKSDGYLEAQIHTKEAHKVEYFEEILFTRGVPDHLEKLLKERGIKYRVLEEQ